MNGSLVKVLERWLELLRRYCYWLIFLKSSGNGMRTDFISCCLSVHVKKSPLALEFLKLIVIYKVTDS